MFNCVPNGAVTPTSRAIRSICSAKHALVSELVEVASSSWLTLSIYFEAWRNQFLAIEILNALLDKVRLLATSRETLTSRCQVLHALAGYRLHVACPVSLVLCCCAPCRAEGGKASQGAQPISGRGHQGSALIVSMCGLREDRNYTLLRVCLGHMAPGQYVVA